MQCDGCRCFLRSWRLYRAQPGMDEQSKQYVGTVSLPQMFAPFTSGINYLRGGSSESLFWKWSVVKPVVHPYPRLRTNRLKFDWVSWALYLFYGETECSWSDVVHWVHTSMHIWDTRTFWNFEVNNEVLMLRFGKSLLHILRDRKSKLGDSPPI